MKIYVICPVRQLTSEQRKEIDEYVAKYESEGHEICLPYRDVPQTTPTEIVNEELRQIELCDEVHIFWVDTSFGSHFDLGATMGLKKPTRLIKVFTPGEYHSYETVIKEYAN